MTDRLTLTRALESSGMQSAAAERIATEIYDAIHDNVATKQDLREMEQRLTLRFEQVERRMRWHGPAARSTPLLASARLGAVARRPWRNQDPIPAARRLLRGSGFERRAREASASSTGHPSNGTGCCASCAGHRATEPHGGKRRSRR